MKISDLASDFAAAVLEYDTPKIVHIKSRRIGVFNRLIQLLIIGYIVGYVIVYSKGYQDTEMVSGTITTKMKGVSYSNLSNPIYRRLWDNADYVIPPEEHNALFVMTTMTISPDQTQGKCPESPDISNVKCTNDSQCPSGMPVYAGNGVRTGRCVEYSPGVRTCEIYAWCPVENDILPLADQPVIRDAQSFTILIKNNIRFDRFGLFKRNILKRSGKDYLKSCNYNATDEIDMYCPIFEIGNIIQQANISWKDISVKGGLVGIIIHWECNLDFDADFCLPRYEFKRLDDPEAKLARGYNFRFPSYDDVNGTVRRTLTKAYGIRFEIQIKGKAGKFSLYHLILNIASGIALLSIATVVCDVCVLYFHKKRSYYFDKKYQMVDDDESRSSYGVIE